MFVYVYVFVCARMCVCVRGCITRCLTRGHSELSFFFYDLFICFVPQVSRCRLAWTGSGMRGWGGGGGAWSDYPRCAFLCHVDFIPLRAFTHTQTHTHTTYIYISVCVYIYIPTHSLRLYTHAHTRTHTRPFLYGGSNDGVYLTCP